MDRLLKRYLFLILAVLTFITAGFFEHRLLHKHPEQMLLKKFQEELFDREKDLKIRLDEITGIVSDTSFKGDYIGRLNKYDQSLEKHGFGFLVYKNGELKYWSDRLVSFNSFPVTHQKEERLIKLPNGYYLLNQVITKDQTIVGLILIKNDYSHENEYLQNTFQKSFNLPEDYIISTKKEGNGYPITASDGKYLFSIEPAGKILCTKAQLVCPGILYIISLILILLFARCEFKKSNHPIAFKLLVLAGALFIFYWLHIVFQFPKVFYVIGFFTPEQFGYSIWLPSLGDYLLATLFFFFWALNFGYDADIKFLTRGIHLHTDYVALFILFILGCLYLLVNSFILILIENSSFSFSLNHIVELSVQSVIAYFSIALLLLGLAVISVRIIDDIRSIMPRNRIIIFTLSVALLLAGLQYLILAGISYLVLGLFFAFILMLLLFSKAYLRNFTLSYLITIISLFAVYSLFIVYKTVTAKEREEQRTYAFTLVSEHDPQAEIDLTRIQDQIKHDSIIPKLLITPFDNEQEVQHYITNKYFGGYFRKYDIQVVLCTKSTILDIQPDHESAPCYPFFDESIDRDGLQVEGTNFYFMDNMNGRITYLGKIRYPYRITNDTTGITVYIELNSSLVSEGIGYPELLLDRAMKKPESYQRFDYAKYSAGQLVDTHGDFAYNQHISSYNLGDEEYTYKKWGGYEHIIYHTRGDNYVIVSREIYGLVAYLISFPYLFVFYFLLTILLLLAGSRFIRKKSLTFDFRFKVQASIISTVLLSLIIVAVGTVFYNIDTYNTKHREDLDEKMKSIAAEIEMSKDRLKNLTDANQEWLYNDLIDLSNVFRTDVNIYGTDGELIASSRPEIYEQGLISRRINSEAYYALFHQYETSHFQPENIGSLSYLSAYQPVIDDNGDYLGFINLPYFTRQDKYSQEITTVIVAFINLYVIFFLASLIVAVFVSNQITKPLTLIRENLRKIELGKRSEPINYVKNDEIGSLVKEYNRKVDELAASAELLARSERETAWREMAKQIAHEIKNPLTPMKLNIQNLQRKKGNPEELEESVEKVSQLLIEQIDNLSSIATEFSNFAKIPTARNQIFNLAAQLRKAIDLFETEDKSIISLNIENSEDISVKADRDQFSRAILNLIKNAIQAIPPTQEAKINILLNRQGHNARIMVSDNGSGIAKELQDKLFSPSFTTKSGGMGLGLAIVKNIVENFRGRIWFKTRLGIGTTFFIEIPVYEEEENDEDNGIKR